MRLSDTIVEGKAELSVLILKDAPLKKKKKGNSSQNVAVGTLLDIESTYEISRLWSAQAGDFTNFPIQSEATGTRPLTF